MLASETKENNIKKELRIAILRNIENFYYKVRQNDTYRYTAPKGTP
jgi:hypothetical protein